MRTDNLVHEICARIDPFCGAAAGAKRAGGSSGMTLPYTYVTNITVTTGVAGDAYVGFGPGPNPGACVTNLAPTTSLFPATGAHPDAIGTSPSFISAIRVVSAGVKWHDVTALTAAGGVVIPMIADDGLLLLDGNTHILADLIRSYRGVAYDRRKPGYAILQPTDNNTASQFQRINNAGSEADTNPWPTFMMYVSGPNSTAVLNVQLIMHVEIQVDPDSGVPGTNSRPNPTVDHILTNYNSKVGQGDKKDIHTGVIEWAKRQAMRIGERVISRGLDIFDPPPRQRRIQNVD